MSSVLVLGAGYLAGHIGMELAAAGLAVTLSSRRRPDTPETRGLGWRRADVRDGVAGLVRDTAPDLVVVVHGPSDITWCETYAAEAMAAHHGGAEHLARAVGGRRVLLISTDNVFSGRRTSNAEGDPVKPANAYGRAKLAAEQTLLATGNALALRVSLVFGWDASGLRPNFFTSCWTKMTGGQPVPVPDDHWNTPVLVHDVAAWTRALLLSAHTGVVHLGGPRRISRIAWARHIAEACGADPGLVRPVRRADSAYACRPRNACLHSERAAALPELNGLAPEDVLEASSRLAADQMTRGGIPS